MERLTLLLVCLFPLALPGVVFAEGKRPMKVEDLFAFKRVNDSQVSPDGRLVAYVVTEVDQETGALTAHNAFNLDFPAAVAFADVDRRPRTLTRKTKRRMRPLNRRRPPKRGRCEPCRLNLRPG